jgi:4-amino-4-deoxy-L-arabinose transferase-like glycosyltransferase
VRLLAQSPLAGLLAGLLVAGYPTLVYSATQVSASNLYLPLEVALLGLLLRTAGGLTRTRTVLLGLGLGLLALLRAEAVVLIPLLAIWLWRCARATSVRQKAVHVASMVLIAALLPVGWMVNSSLRLGAPVTSISTTAGFNLWIGNHEGASGSQKQTFLGGAGAAQGERVEETIERLPTTDDYELLRDDVYMAEALGYMRAHPFETLARNVKKLGLVVVGDVYDPRATLLTAGLNVLVLGVGIWGALGTRLRRHAWVLLLGYAATAVAVCFVFFTLERYTLPLKLVLMVFVAVRLAGVLSALGGRSSRPTA